MLTKRYLRAKLFFAATFLISCGSALAQGGDDFLYLSDGVSITIIGHRPNPKPASLVIPAEIDGLPVRHIKSLGSSISPPRGPVTSITIPSSVTTIGDTVFTKFTSITSITVPDSVTSMGYGAFGGCTSLTSATLSNALTELNQTFNGCTALSTVDLPDQLISMEDTFSGCTSLASITLPETVTSITGAFFNCTKLSQVTLPAGLKSVGSGAFTGCIALSNIDFLPESVEIIADSAFRDCTGLTSANFPRSLTTIGANAFEGCTGLTHLEVPETVSLIEDGAFWRCQNLTGFNLPDRYLASLANLGLDYNAQLATDALVTGIANRLAKNPEFITKLANEILATSGHYGLSTQTDIANVVNQTPQTVREVIAEVAAESPVAHAITSSLSPLSTKKGKVVQYQVTTTFSAPAFSASGLPDGLTIDSSNGRISGKARKVGVYHVFLHAGTSGGGVVSAVKKIIVVP